VAEGFAKGIFHPPAKPDYMLSKQNSVPNAKGEVIHFLPHVMFYVPYLTNAELGVGDLLGADGNPPVQISLPEKALPTPSISFP
jgi:hypothetical protein